MAKQSDLKFAGTVGNVIFYERTGGYYMRTKPVSVKQSVATKASAGKFGEAVKISKCLRNSLQSLLPFSPTKKMILSFNTAIYKWMLTNDHNTSPLPFISGFEFHEQSLLKERLTLAVTTNRNGNGVMELQWPALVPDKNISAPSRAKNIRLKIAAAVCNMNNYAETDSYSTEIEIDYNNNLLPAQNISFPLHASANDMIVIAISLQYCRTSKGVPQPVNDLRWQPAGIVWAGIATY